jgi:hypothetical protein
MRRTDTGVLVFVVVALTAGTARADEITDWNQTMLRAGLVAGTNSLPMSRIAAIVQASVFDAVNGIDRRYTPVHVAPTGPAGASRRAAAVQAAYVALVKAFPTQQATFDARRTVSLTVIGTEESAASIASGIAWGEEVANQIWDWRLTDGIGVTTPTWPGNTELGQWRPTPNDPYPGTSPNGAGYPQFVEMTPWAIASASQFRPGPPPALTSRRYAKDLNETKQMGSFSSPTRTPDQTIASLFWAAVTGSSATASYLWNRVALSLIDRRDGDHDDRGDRRQRDRDTLLDNARVLGTLNVAMADAMIGCWDAKYTYNFWRPITAIREPAEDGNRATTPDPAWTPLLSTPAHPEYPSAHGCISSAAATVLGHVFGERTHFDMDSDLMLGVTRSFPSFQAALDEVKDARVFAGIHFRNSTEVGGVLGTAVAEWVLGNAFQRVD